MMNKKITFLLLTIFGAPLATYTKTTYEIFTETLQERTASTLGTIAKMLLSKKAKQTLSDDVALQIAESTEEEEEEEEAAVKMATIMSMADKLKRLAGEIEESQKIANQLNSELDSALNKQPTHPKLA